MNRSGATRTEKLYMFTVLCEQPHRRLRPQTRRIARRRHIRRANDHSGAAGTSTVLSLRYAQFGGMSAEGQKVPSTEVAFAEMRR